ncbi:hypothetical protein [Clostridium ganghwense]|uniref:Uncharacterized protein n=1 Tax=Clostridium ganghwense TaxID=312089 RepID=A0ABT4CMX4_9CLOT|nr:hypothetical protein [Clostridium ganghwense]MCY6370397.1 hypothetical protein [Clostridium ganghwense]
MIKDEMIEKIIQELKEIEIVAAEEIVKTKVQKLVEYINSVSEIKKEKAFKDILHEKMKESKIKNPELHIKLYMLYRDLQNGKVSEHDANRMYEDYLQMYPDDMMVY